MAALLTCPCVCSRLAAKDTGSENQSTKVLENSKRVSDGDLLYNFRWYFPCLLSFSETS